MRLSVTGGDWTDRRRPVLDNYRDFCNSPAIKTMEAEGFDDPLQLLHDLAAVLRAGAAIATFKDVKTVDENAMAYYWQAEARDPETGKRVFP